LIRDLVNQQLIPNYVIHSWSFTSTPEVSSKDKFDRLSVLGHLGLLFLTKALDSAGIYTPVRLGIAANRLFDVTGDGDIEPEKAPLVAGSIVIGQEYPNVRVICISVDTQWSASVAADRVLTEIFSNHNDSHVAYRGTKRFVEEYVAAPILPNDVGIRLPRHQGAVVIFGGLGNIGLQIAQQLIDSRRTQVVLVGKSSLPERTLWHDYKVTNDLTARRIRAIEALEDAGGEVLLTYADVADKEQVELVLRSAEERFGGLAGIIFATAATTADSIFRPISQLTPEDCEEQSVPKVNGLYSLASCLRNRTVDFCLLLSSNASILGGIGMYAYAAANAFLNAFATQQSDTNQTWISSCWDGWPNTLRTGQRAISSSMEEMKLNSVNSADAVARIIRCAPKGVISVSLANIEARRRFWVDAVSSSTDGLSNSVTSQDPIEGPSAHRHTKDALEDTLAEIWKKQLGAREIEKTDDFFALGGNSLTATQIIAHLRAATGLQIPLRLFFENPTIQQLAKAVTVIQSGQLTNALSFADDKEMIADLSEDEVSAAIALLSKEHDQ